jgi:hypothetical protein
MKSVRILSYQMLVLLLCMSIAPVASSQRQSAKPTPKVGLIVKSNDTVGVILPADARAPNGLYPPGTVFWTPSEDDVLILERGLVAFLQTSKDPRVIQILKNIKAYKRQYRGIVNGGQKVIIVRFFCDAVIQDLMEEDSIILDGGSCFFNLQYSTRTRIFSHLEINGLA